MDVCFLWVCITRFERLLTPPLDIRVAYRFVCLRRHTWFFSFVSGGWVGAIWCTWRFQEI